MTRQPTLALTLVALTFLPGLGVAQTNDRLKSPPTGDKATPQLTNVKILEVNDGAKTITVGTRGKTFTFDAKTLKSLPKPGQTIAMWGDPTGGSGERRVCAVVECDMGWGSGPCIKCFDYQPLRMSGMATDFEKAPPPLTKVQVVGVDDRAKTVTVMAEGGTLAFDAKKLKSLPKRGETIVMCGKPTSGPGQRLVCAVVECDMGWGSGPCIKCFDFQPLG